MSDNENTAVDERRTVSIEKISLDPKLHSAR
jgi:hypothetical protein